MPASAFWPWDPALGYAAFEYAPRFLETGIELSPVMTPLSTGPGARNVQWSVTEWREKLRDC